MLNKLVADISQFEMSARTVFGLLSALGVISLTAMAFWNRIQTDSVGSSE